MSLRLDGKTVVLGVTGGIAAYKACEVVSRLKKLGAQVRVIMTESAQHFVAPLTFESLSGGPVCSDIFAEPAQWEIQHISWAKAADLFLVAPATANLIGKYACGIADDMLTSTLLATTAPVLLAPAMNTNMWRHPATQQNLSVLLSRGVKTVGPGSGYLACGDSGDGRMSEPEEIVEAACAILTPRQDLEGLRLLVTAGPTREALDPVRFLTNRSSGKMGYAIAEAAVARGACVTLVTGPVHLPVPCGVEAVPIQSTQDLYQTMLSLVPRQDVVIQSAAPADFTAQAASQKIKKQGDEPLTLTLYPTPDVAAAIGKMKKPGQTLVAFAAETQFVAEHAQEKLMKKNADLMVANDVTQPGAGFDVDTNVAMLLTKDGCESLPLMSKRELADQILDKVLDLRK